MKKLKTEAALKRALRNHRDSLSVFLSNGEVPFDNNVSERALRRQAIARKNFMFLGTDEGGAVIATFSSQLRDAPRAAAGLPARRLLSLAHVAGAGGQSA